MLQIDGTVQGYADVWMGDRGHETVALHASPSDSVLRMSGYQSRLYGELNPEWVQERTSQVAISAQPDKAELAVRDPEGDWRHAPR